MTLVLFFFSLSKKALFAGRWRGAWGSEYGKSR